MSKSQYSEYIQREWGGLVGRSITKVRQLTPKEEKEIGWDDYISDVAIVLELDNGTKLIPSRDPELNSEGYLLVIEK
jgi:hypothetical protein